MKKLLLITFSVFSIISCGNNKEEQMIYDLKAKDVKNIYNTTLEELNFNINKIEKLNNITGADSVTFYRNKFINTYVGENESKITKDTTSFDYAINLYDTLINSTQNLILTYVRSGKSYKNYELKRERDKYIDAKVNVSVIKDRYDWYSKRTDSVLSYKYKVNYSLENPTLNNVKQTFNRYAYSDAKNSKLIFEEEIK